MRQKVISRAISFENVRFLFYFLRNYISSARKNFRNICSGQRAYNIELCLYFYKIEPAAIPILLTVKYNGCFAHSGDCCSHFDITRIV